MQTQDNDWLLWQETKNRPDWISLQCPYCGEEICWARQEDPELGTTLPGDRSFWLKGMHISRFFCTAGIEIDVVTGMEIE